MAGDTYPIINNEKDYSGFWYGTPEEKFSNFDIEFLNRIKTIFNKVENKRYFEIYSNSINKYGLAQWAWKFVVEKSTIVINILKNGGVSEKEFEDYCLKSNWYLLIEWYLGYRE